VTEEGIKESEKNVDFADKQLLSPNIEKNYLVATENFRTSALFKFSACFSTISLKRKEFNSENG
jgi:hypothetical protein